LSWNSIGSLAHLGITDTANPLNTQTCNFANDDLARVNLDDCGAKWHQTFAFDPFGNISKMATAGTSFLPTYNQSTNQIASLPGCAPITYDGNGNLTNDCAHTYGSDSDGIITSIDSNPVTSDALGRQVEWAVGAGFRQVVYDPLNRKFALMNGVSTLVKGFISLPGGGTMVDIPGSWPAYYRHSDWLGSSRLATTQARGLYYDGAYAAYGEDYASTGTTDLDFTGQNQDTAAGLYDFLYRKYSPVQGRWLSPDPSGLAAVDMTNPQSWNRYAYVLNNPLSLVDSKGLDCAFFNDDDTSVEEVDEEQGTDCTGLGGSYVPGSLTGWTNNEDGTINNLTFDQWQDTTLNVGWYQNTTISLGSFQFQYNPLGHVAIGLGSRTPVGLNPADDLEFLSVLMGNSMQCSVTFGCTAASVWSSTVVPGVISPQDPANLVENVSIPVSGEQAAQIQIAIDFSSVNPPNYSVTGPQPSCDCGTWAQQVMSAGGLKSGPPAPIPGVLIEQLNQIYFGW
jgi:RHS repeat-associated protein